MRISDWSFRRVLFRSVGSNTAWCHPIVYQRIMAARAERGTKVVVIDPRRTESCEDVDLHLPLRPGSDVALMNGLLAHCRREGLLDKGFLDGSVAVPEGFLEGIDIGHDLERSEEHTSELQSLMRISYAVFCLKKKKEQ